MRIITLARNVSRQVLIPAGVVVFLLMALSRPVFAGEKALGSFGAWTAYASHEGGQSVCYMVDQKTLAPPVQKRAPPYLMITHRPVEASTDTFSYGAGASLDAKYGARLTLGKDRFDLFTVKDTGWARDGVTDHKIAAVLIAAATAKAAALVRAMPARHGDKAIGDRFDLTGADGAYHAIGKACGLIVDKPRKAQGKAAAKPVSKAAPTKGKPALPKN